VHQIIRSHRYIGLDAILADVLKAGVGDISRSALGRYVPALKQRDSLKATPEEDTVITVVERRTGQVRVVRIGAPADLVVAQIEKLRAPDPIS
jgi:hypothetical protein